MSNNKERKIPDYLKFPFERYIMVRVEFLILTQNELEAKIMRIIEWAIESKRDELSRKGLEAPDEVWVTIPESVFMDWLYGTVQSETTFKAAIKSLVKKYLIFKRPSGTGRYDALEYTLNKPLISKLFELFPEKINEVDMAAIMKQPRKSNKESEVQLLTPSIIDPLIKRIRDAIIDPLNHQLLTPSLSLREGQKLTPKKKEKETVKDNIPNGIAPTVANLPTDLSVTLDTATKDQLYARLNELEKQSPELEHFFTPSSELSTPVDKQASGVLPIAKTATKNTEPKTTRNSRKTRNTEPLQKPLPKLEEPKMSDAARAVWDEWVTMPWHGGIIPKLTQTAADHCETLSQANELITRDILFKVRNFANKNDTKGFYKGKAWTLGNVVSEYPRWKSAQDQVTTEAKQEPKRPKTVQEMDALERVKYYEEKYGSKKTAVTLSAERQ